MHFFHELTIFMLFGGVFSKNNDEPTNFIMTWTKVSRLTEINELDKQLSRLSLQQTRICDAQVKQITTNCCKGALVHAISFTCAELLSIKASFWLDDSGVGS